MNAFRSTVFAALCVSSVLQAQTGPLVGFATDGAANAAVLRQRLCDPPIQVCPGALPPPALPWGGGAALDSFRNTLWHTEGTRLLGVDLDGCARRCVVPAATVLGPRTTVGGLTFDAETASLFHAESIPGLGAIVTYDVQPSQTCPQSVRACRFSLPTQQHTVGALALDKNRDLFYVATSVFTGTAGPQTRLLVLRRDDPGCNVFCMIGVPNCGNFPLAAITAMTYDACDDRLYLSDGRRIAVYVVRQNPASGCPQLIAESCCTVNDPLSRRYHGFDRQTIEARQLGSGCLPRRTCPACPTPPVLRTVGLPQVGNGAFGLRIEDAPVGSTGFVLVNIGGCQPLPFGCGTLYTGLPAPLLLGPAPIAGVGCSGTGQVTLPIPENFGLCGLLLCAQGLLVCPAGGLGLSSAQVIPIGS